MRIADILSIHGITKQTNKIPNLFGFSINTSDSNPTESVTYIGGGEGITPATSQSLSDGTNKWLSIYPFNQIRVVAFENGQVVDEINPNDFTKTINGNTVSSTSDVMIEIPKVYWKFVSTATGFDVMWSKNKEDEDFKALAHTKNGIEKDFIYIGAYEGYVQDNKLYSKSGLTPTSNVSISDFITYAQNKGTGYGILNFYTISLLQILFVTMFKTLNSESVAYGSATKPTTGSCDKKGMNCGSSSNTEAMKFLGIENLLGSYDTFVSNIFNKTSNTVAINDGSVDEKNFDNYPIIINRGTSYTTSHYVSKVVGTTEGCFISSTASASYAGSSTTYYCDYQYFSTSYPCFTFGGNSANTQSGIFRLYGYWGKTEASSGISARLIYV